MNLTLSGYWRDAADMTFSLLQSGFRLAYEANPGNAANPALVALASREDIPANLQGWLAWQRVEDAALTLLAYQHGARAVFPPDMPASLLAQSVRQMLQPVALTEKPGLLRTIRRGAPVFLETGNVLTVHEGVLATMMIYGDGAAVLLGLTGAGQIVVAHPDDECLIQVVAHTSAVISVEDWEQAVLRPGFPEKLRTRLQRMEAWSAMQARPYLDQRVLGILSLLAEEFGLEHPQGTLVDLRLTHAQLAAAVGATRTTITRVLGELRMLDKIAIDGHGHKERFILRESKKACH